MTVPVPVPLSPTVRVPFAILSLLLATLLMTAVGASGWRAQAAPEPRWPDPRWASAEELDSFVASRFEELHLPGLAVVVVAEGEVLYEGTYGEAATGVPVTLDTPFRLGSTSKQFTGLAVQQLIARDDFGLDTPVVELLPAFVDSAAWSGTTVRHLLAHRSGLSTDDGHDQWELRPESGTIQGEAERLATVPLTHPPGQTYEYSNANHTLLGAIVEQVTGLPFETAFQELVAEPLGLTSTTTDLELARGHGLAVEHYTWFGRLSLPTPAPASGAAGPSAYLTSSARDLTTVVQAHLGELGGMDGEVLAAARRPLGSVAEHVDYASGWEVRGLWELTDRDEGWDDPARPKMWEHHGAIGRAQTHLAFAPDHGLGVVALTNTGPGTSEFAWSNFTYDLIHAALGTLALEWPPDRLVQAAPALMVGVPLLQLLTLTWLLMPTRARPRPWVPLGFGALLSALALVFSLVVVPERTGQPLVDSVWIAFAPDLAVSMGLMVLAAVLTLVLVVVRWRQLLRLREARGPGVVDL